MPQEIKIQVKPEDLKGSYSNHMQIQHTKEEFCLDFYNIFAPSGTLASRIVMSPGHLKRMINALNDNISKYEGSFGKIEEAVKPSEPNIGFGL